MNGSPITTILLIEDNKGDVRLFQDMLSEHNATIELTHVGLMSEAEEQLSKRTFHVTFLDLGLPDAEGAIAVRRVRAAAPDATLVILTGFEDEAMALEALQQGAQDYLIKGQIEARSLVRALHHAIERNGMKAALALERERLQKANEVLDRKNAELEAFTYSVSHDLKEPLRAIEGFSEYLLQNHLHQLEPRAQDLLNRIVKASLRMKFLIEDVLELSRAGRETDLEIEVTDTRQVVDEVIQSLRTMIDEHHATIEVGQLPLVTADRSRVGQIFRNLISNGIKYNRSSQPTIQLGLVASKKGLATIFVKDDGIGIDAQYHEKVFRLFERLHAREEYEGTGAGLAIVKRAVEALGGKVWLESSEGNGTTFFVSLPSATSSMLAVDPALVA